MGHFGYERDAWWRVVVDSKYGSLWGGWCSLEPASAFGAGGALSSWQVPLGWGCGRTSENVGILSQASLDLLWGDAALKVAFPTLFGIACVKDASVADNLEFLVAPTSEM